jgi:adenylosuccinate lyase
MPHKRNPVGCENLSGLARVVRSNALAAFENVALWHERDISHSSVERVIIPDSTILVDYMLNRLTGILSGLQVYPERKETWAGASLHQNNNNLTERDDQGCLRAGQKMMLSWKTKKIWASAERQGYQKISFSKRAE